MRAKFLARIAPVFNPPPLVTFSERTLYGYGSQMNTAPERFVRQSIDFAAGATIQTRTGYVA
jgi:hypothetical protein